MRDRRQLSCSTGAVSQSSWAVGKIHQITLTEILRDLAPLNEGRDKKDRITYDSLWVHFRRHYDLAGIVAYRRTRMVRGVQEVKQPCGMTGVGRPVDTAPEKLALSTKKSVPR